MTILEISFVVIVEFQIVYTWWDNWYELLDIQICRGSIQKQLLAASSLIFTPLGSSCTQSADSNLDY